MAATEVVPNWQTIVDQKSKDRAARIPTEWKFSSHTLEQCRQRPIEVFQEPAVNLICPSIISKRELELTAPTQYDAIDLLQMLNSGDVTSLELATAFCKRAAIAHELTNCLTEILFEPALRRARELDKLKPEERGRLHGLPVTVKDSFHIKGSDSSIGITSLCNKPAENNSMLVSILETNGAIIIAKTTVPQTMLTADTDSIVHGRTTNAYRSDFGAAGSSGGEGVMLAMGGSPLGIGTDGAGSIRMPAFANGVIGLRTSGYRWPLDGVAIFGRGLMGSTILGPVSVAGPLCRSVRDAQLMLKVVSEARPWMKSPFLLPSPWLNIQTTVKPFNIGVWTSHDHIHVLSPVARGLSLAQDRLSQSRRVRLSSFNGPSIARAWSLQKEWTQIQDIRPLQAMTANEPLTQIVRVTNILQPDEPRPPFDLDRFHSLNAEIAQLVLAMARAWVSDEDEPLDALLWVPAPHTALPFDQYTDLTFTGLFNVIDWPAITLPLGESVSSADGDTSSSSRLSDGVLFGAEDRRLQQLFFDDPEKFEGLPLSVQLVGRRGEDERLLVIADEVHKIVRGLDT